MRLHFLIWLISEYLILFSLCKNIFCLENSEQFVFEFETIMMWLREDPNCPGFWKILLQLAESFAHHSSIFHIFSNFFCFLVHMQIKYAIRKCIFSTLDDGPNNEIIWMIEENMFAVGTTWDIDNAKITASWMWI